MKKIVMLSVVVALVLVGATARGKSLSVGDLPPAAQSLLSSVFSGVEVQQVKKNFKDYQVKLADHTLINFDRDGGWESIMNRNGLPANALPEKISATVTSTYPLLDVVKIEKEFGKIEVTLSDGSELLFDMEGKGLGRKSDS